MVDRHLAAGSCGLYGHKLYASFVTYAQRPGTPDPCHKDDGKPLLESHRRLATASHFLIFSFFFT